MEIPQDWLETLLRLGAAILLSAIIGFEREIRNKPAGLRTHMLVGLGASSFTLFSLHLARDLAIGNNAPSLDVLKTVGAIIGGLGFLGGGAIIQSRGEVHGMTTAAGIWIAGAVGVGCGIGDYFSVTMMTALAVFCLIPVRLLEQKLALKSEENEPPKNSE